MGDKTYAQICYDKHCAELVEWASDKCERCGKNIVPTFEEFMKYFPDWGMPHLSEVPDFCDECLFAIGGVVGSNGKMSRPAMGKK